MSKGCVYLVGAGPGDPGLITVRGMELLSQADVVVYDYLASPRLLNSARPDAEVIYVGKKAGQHTLKQHEINALLVAKALTGAMVVRLKGGDPYVFGRGGEEALAAVDAGLRFEVVPGITAGVAAAAYAGIPVTHRELASNLGLVTGHETPDKADSDLDFDALAKWRGTLVFYMGVSNLEPICRNLTDRGLDPETPAAIIRWGTKSQQRTVVATVGTLPEAARAADIKPPAVTVIGQVVQLRDQLNWFESRPLFGRRIVVTRARTQASRMTSQLESLGADVLEMPAIQIVPPDDLQPLRDAIGEVAGFDWIVFTSANGVAAFFDALHEAGLDSRALAGSKLCTIGPVTAETLAAHGLSADAQPAKFVSSEIASTLAAADSLAGKTILCPRADVAPVDLIKALEAEGAVVKNVVAYCTRPDCAGADQVIELLGADDVQWVTFTSSSTVKNFFGAVDPKTVRAASVRLASIGPVTSDTLREFGFEPDTEAESHTIDGLTRAILDCEDA